MVKKFLCIMLAILMLVPFFTFKSQAESFPAITGPVDKVFNVITNLPIDLDSINMDNCYAEDAYGKRIPLLPQGESVPNQRGYLTKFKGESLFTEGENYVINLLAGIRSTDGKEMSLSYSVNFTALAGGSLTGETVITETGAPVYNQAGMINVEDVKVDLTETNIAGNTSVSATPVRVSGDPYGSENDSGLNLNIPPGSTGGIEIKVPLDKFQGVVGDPSSAKNPNYPYCMFLNFEVERMDGGVERVARMIEPTIEGNEAVFVVSPESIENYYIKSRLGGYSDYEPMARSVNITTLTTFWTGVPKAYKSEHFLVYVPLSNLEGTGDCFDIESMHEYVELLEQVEDHFRSNGYLKAEKWTDPIEIYFKKTNGSALASFVFDGINKEDGDIFLSYYLDPFINVNLDMFVSQGPLRNKNTKSMKFIQGLMAHELCHYVQSLAHHTKFKTNVWYDEAIATYFEYVFIGDMTSSNEYFDEGIGRLFPEDIDKATPGDGYGRPYLIRFLMEKTNGNFIKDMMETYTMADHVYSRPSFEKIYNETVDRAYNGDVSFQPENLMHDFYRWLAENFYGAKYGEKLVLDYNYRQSDNWQSDTDNPYPKLSMAEVKKFYYRMEVQTSLVPSEQRQGNFKETIGEANIQTYKMQPMFIPIRFHDKHYNIDFEALALNKGEYLEIEVTKGSSSGKVILYEINCMSEMKPVGIEGKVDPKDPNKEVFVINDADNKFDEGKRYILLYTNGSSDDNLNVKVNLGKGISGGFYEDDRISYIEVTLYNDVGGGIQENRYKIDNLTNLPIYLDSNTGKADELNAWIPMFPTMDQKKYGSWAYARMTLKYRPATNKYIGDDDFIVLSQKDLDTGKYVYYRGINVSIAVTFENKSNFSYKPKIDGNYQIANSALVGKGDILFTVNDYTRSMYGSGDSYYESIVSQYLWKLEAIHNIGTENEKPTDNEGFNRQYYPEAK